MFGIENWTCFYFFGPFCKNQEFCRVLIYTVGKVFSRRFRSNNHIVEIDLGTMKVLELKPKFVFIFLAHCAKTRHSAVFLHTPLERSCQDLSESIFTLCKNILELWKFWNWKLNLFLTFWRIVQKLGVLSCSNIHRWKGHGKAFLNQ